MTRHVAVTVAVNHLLINSVARVGGAQSCRMAARVQVGGLRRVARVRPFAADQEQSHQADVKRTRSFTALTGLHFSGGTTRELWILALTATRRATRAAEHMSLSVSSARPMRVPQGDAQRESN